MDALGIVAHHCCVARRTRCSSFVLGHQASLGEIYKEREGTGMHQTDGENTGKEDGHNEAEGGARACRGRCCGGRCGRARPSEQASSTKGEAAEGLDMAAPEKSVGKDGKDESRTVDRLVTRRIGLGRID